MAQLAVYVPYLVAGAVAGIGLALMMQPDVEAQPLSDLSPGGSSYGSDIPLVFGTTKVPGNIIWASDLIPAAHTESAKGGPEITTYTYSQHLAVLVCAGEADIRKIWINGKLHLDMSESNTGMTGNTGGIRIYTGDETQVADSLLESYLGAGNVPAHRGYCYVVFENLQRERYGNGVLSFEFEAVGSGALTRPVPTMLSTTAVFNGFVDRFTGRMLWLEQNHKNIRYWDFSTGAVVKTITTVDPERMYWITPAALGTFWAWKANTFDIYDVATGAVIATASHPAGAATQVMKWREYDSSFLLVYGGSLLQYTEGPDNTWAYTTINTIPEVITHWQSIEVTPYGLVVLYSDYHKKLVVLDGLYGVILDHDVVASVASGTWINTSTYDPVRNKVYICTSTNTDMIVVDLNPLVPTVTELAVSGSGGVWPLYHQQSDSVVITGGGPYPVVTVRDPENLAAAADSFGDSTFWPYAYMDGPAIEIPGLDDSVAHTVGGAGVDIFRFGKRVASNQVALSAIVSELCLRAGLSASDIDVTQLTDMVDGFKTA